MSLEVPPSSRMQRLLWPKEYLVRAGMQSQDVGSYKGNSTTRILVDATKHYIIEMHKRERLGANYSDPNAGENRFEEPLIKDKGMNVGMDQNAESLNSKYVRPLTKKGDDINTYQNVRSLRSTPSVGNLSTTLKVASAKRAV